MTRQLFGGAALMACALACFAPQARAQSPQRQVEAALSGVVRDAIVREIGGMKAEFSDGWGHQARVWTGKTKVVFQGIKSKVEKIYDTVNDGQWKKGWARLENARNEFDFQVRNFRKTPGFKEIKFQIYVRAYMRAGGQVRAYKNGIKLYDVDGSGRARVHLTIDMKVYLSNKGTRINWEAENVDFKYSDVVVDKVGVLGGESARLLGDAVKKAITQWFPQKERDAIAKAKNAVYGALSGSAKLRSELTQIINKL